MKIYELPTPSFLVNLDQLEKNIEKMGEICNQNGKELWPMVKTHKSTHIAGMQLAAGAKGFLTGTVDEAEKLIECGFREIMIAYPVAAKENIDRVIQLIKKAHVILSFDGIEAASEMGKALAANDACADYLIIIDCGLHRFGVMPENILTLARQLKPFCHLKFKGIATHPGQVYGKRGIQEVETVAADEAKALARAQELLTKEGHTVEIVATGSTPTASFVVKDQTITVLRPGNYVFYDALQVALGVVPAESCALTVLATVIANPRPGLLIMDAGSKCFGLDKGAHGISLASGFGMIKGHPELTVEGLSEEVGKIAITDPTTVKVGDKIEVIPNHACSAANMTSYLIGHRNNVIEKIIDIDARGGTCRKPLGLS